MKWNTLLKMAPVGSGANGAYTVTPSIDGSAVVSCAGRIRWCELKFDVEQRSAECRETARAWLVGPSFPNTKMSPDPIHVIGLSVAICPVGVASPVMRLTFKS